jgi:hypothetical protein
MLFSIIPFVVEAVRDECHQLFQSLCHFCERLASTIYLPRTARCIFSMRTIQKVHVSELYADGTSTWTTYSYYPQYTHLLYKGYVTCHVRTFNAHAVVSSGRRHTSLPQNWEPRQAQVLPRTSSWY